MKLILGIFLVTSISKIDAQFDLFSAPIKDEYRDSLGMRNAIDVWSETLKKIAMRNNPKFNRANIPRSFTLEPPMVNANDLDLAKFKKDKGDTIINEKLLNLLLPRIKGQNPFTTTTSPTTTTSKPTKPVTSTIATTLITTTTSPTTTTTEALTPITETTANIENSTPSVTNAPTTTSAESNNIPKREIAGRFIDTEQDNDKMKKSVEFTSDEKSVVEEKKIDKKTGTKSTVEVTQNDKNEKTSEIESSNKSERENKFEPHSMNINIRTSNEESDEGSLQIKDNEEKPSYIKKLEELYKKEQELVEKEIAKMSIAELFAADSEGDNDNNGNNSTTIETTTDHTSTTFETTTTTPTTTTITTTTERVSSSSIITTTTLEPSTSNPLQTEEELEHEALEVLKSLDEEEKEDQKKKEETKRRQEERDAARKKIKSFLKKMDSLRANAKSSTISQTSTTVEPSTKTVEVSTTTTEPSTTTTEPSSTTTAEPVTTTLIETTTKEKSTTSKVLPTIPEAEDDEEETTTETPTTMTAITSTNKVESSTMEEEVMVDKTTEEPKNTTDKKEDIQEQLAKLPKLSAPELSQLMTPVAGIMDDIRPILSSLLSSPVRAPAARAKAATTQTFESSAPASTGRDILADGFSENSIVGFGSQLAREILNPGSLRRDKMTRDKAMAAKIEEFKARRASIEALPTGAPLDLSNTKEERTTHLPYYLPPPPGYKGPLPPPPPPPPHLSNIPVESNFNSNSFKTATSLPVAQGDVQRSQKNNKKPEPLSPKPAQSKPDSTGYEQGRDEVKTTFVGDSGRMMNGDHTRPTSDYSDMSMPVESFHLAPVNPDPEPPRNSAPRAGPPPGFGGGRLGGFGGGKGPSVPFDEVEKNSQADLSFFTGRRL